MMEAAVSRPLEPAWKGALGLDSRRVPEFYEDSSGLGNVPYAGALRTTLDDLGASGVFASIEFRPSLSSASTSTIQSVSHPCILPCGTKVSPVFLSSFQGTGSETSL